MRNKFKKIACLSILLTFVWCVLGTGTSLAWYVDTDEELKNVFHFAEFDLVVSHRLKDGTWEIIEQSTKVFDDDALYEPGYTQVVYLKIENKGSVPFDFKTAVSVTNFSLATNVFGQPLELHEYLRFGVAIASSEAEMDEQVATRDKAKKIATIRLQNYATNVATINPGQTAYHALVVRMPEEVGNDANFRGTVIPKVELGIIVKADQQK